MNSESKLCKGPCGQVKPLSDFYDSRQGSAVYKFAQCKTCCAERTKLHQAANKDQWAVYGHRRNIRRHYGVEPEQYQAMGEEQKWVCAICGNQTSNGFRLAVDHDHKTRKVRGLLCESCNNGIGRFKDDPELLRKAACYLERDYTAPTLPKPKRQGRPQKSSPNYCTVPGCGRVTPYKKYCQKHYFQLRRTGSTESGLSHSSIEAKSA